MIETVDGVKVDVHLDVDKLPNDSRGVGCLKCSGMLVPIVTSELFKCRTHGVYLFIAGHDGFPIRVQIASIVSDRS